MKRIGILTVGGDRCWAAVVLLVLPARGIGGLYQLSVKRLSDDQ